MTPSNDIVARVSVEEASTFGWERYVGCSEAILGLQTFGLSAPMQVVAQYFGFGPESVVAATKEQIARHAAGDQMNQAQERTS